MAGGGYDLEEIRRRADIVEVISPHVALRKAGRRLSGLCPFHQERTPSFTVDPESGLWHCFGCKAGGDLFRFVEMIEKVDFAEAVELLARRLGVQPRTPQQAGRQRDRDRLLTIYEAARTFFQAQLRTEAARATRAYLTRRGLSPSTIEGFAIGYAPDGWEALLISMGKRGYSGAELARAGLVVPREGGDGFYDRFRNRVIFPINDSSGRVIAFGGRALGDDQQPKYLNSPEGPLFQKGHVLYAFDRARRAMGDSGRALVVEGYLDAIACHDAGFTEAVATMGTALTPDHVELLRRRVSRLVLAFDADSAGMGAALRSRELFEKAGLSVRVVTLPEGLDPDQVVRERGGAALGELVESAAPMIEWELTRVFERVRSDGDAGRMEGLREAAATLAGLPAGVEREYYTQWLVEKWGAGSPSQAAAMEAGVREEIARSAARRRGIGRRREHVTPEQGGVNKQAPDRRPLTGMQAAVLSGMIRYSQVAAPYLERLDPEDFPAGLKDIFTVVRSLIEGAEAVSAQAVVSRLPAESRPLLAELLLTETPDERVEESIRSGVTRIIEARLSRRIAELTRRFGDATSTEEREGIERELSEARRKRSELAGQRLVGSE